MTENTVLLQNPEEETTEEKLPPIVYLCIAQSAVLHILTGICGTFLPEAALSYGIPFPSIGVIFSVHSLMVLISSLISGWCCGKFGYLRVLFFGFAACLGSMAMLAFVPTVFSRSQNAEDALKLLVLARAVGGIGMGCGITATLVCMNRAKPGAAYEMSGYFEASSSIGYTLAAPLGAYFFTAGGFSLPFLVYAVILLVFGVGAAIGHYCVKALNSMELDQKTATQAEAAVVAEACKSCSHFLEFVRETLAPGIACVLASMGLYYTSSTLPVHYTTDFHFNVNGIAVLYALATLVYAIVGLLLATVTDRSLQQWVLCLGLFVGALFTATVGSPNMWVSAASAVLYAMTASMVIIQAFGSVINKRKTDNQYQALAIGLMNSYYYFGEFAGPAAGGFVYDQTNFPVSVRLFGLVVGVYGIIYAFMVFTKKIE